MDPPKRWGLAGSPPQFPRTWHILPMPCRVLTVRRKLTIDVFTGQIFSYPVHLTWEFTSAHPVRSIFPLWTVYGLPMLLLRWVGSGNTPNEEVAPSLVFWTLRTLMFILSFVLEDWAIHELVNWPRQRRLAIIMVASSYVTWTYQTHTFSNSVETLLVAWSLVLIQRIVDEKRDSLLSSAVLSFLVVFGIFNRITFPAFIIIPGLRLIPHFYRKPLSLLSVLLTAVLTVVLAIVVDTSFYSESLTLSTLLTHPVVTPLNNLLYNLQTTNLAQHGLHPYYQHILANLPQLLGPAYILVIFCPTFSLRLVSAVSGILVLSLFQHQEARFLVPAIPLILSSIQLPRTQRRAWIASWIGFNVVFGVLMGTYHQGGIVPTQAFLAGREDATQALWWKTYSPPIWLLNGKNEVLTTTDLMGMPSDQMIQRLKLIAPCRSLNGHNGTYLIAPESATYLDSYADPVPQRRVEEHGLHMEKVWVYRSHLSLDDMDFAEDGIWSTIKRVVGRRGLAAWRVTNDCTSIGSTFSLVDYP
ncbi:MAG: hypothetical protein M1819_007181 [Sarea resinae]|nr:MAG: hypothetical protein M1819_007181 [Sarea resinae]